MLKRKKCKVCKEYFDPFRPLQVVCSTECGHQKAIIDREKLQRRATKERKEKLKTRRDYINEAQVAVNAYVRYRDKDKPCICCGKPLSDGVGSGVGGSFDAGHYRSTGSAPHLRFDADRNIHGQRKACNRYGAGRAVDYRIGLIARIGIQTVEALEADQEPRKHTIDELKAIRDLYRAKLKELKRD